MNGTVTSLGTWHQVLDSDGVHLGAVAEGPAGTWTAAAGGARLPAASFEEAVTLVREEGLAYQIREEPPVPRDSEVLLALRDERGEHCQECRTADGTVHRILSGRDYMSVCQYCRLLRGLIAWRGSQKLRKGETYVLAGDTELWEWGVTYDPAPALDYLFEAA